MNNEIERKFLVKDNSWKKGLSEADSSFIQQAYITKYPDPVVRIRIRDSHAWITIKNAGKGISRMEFEYSIPVTDAVELMKMASWGEVIKRRYEIKYKGKKWEVDEFYGQNQGLILAEIELGSEDEAFVKPPWLGEEVSLDLKYKNSNLALNPFKSWK